MTQSSRSVSENARRRPRTPNPAHQLFPRLAAGCLLVAAFAALLAAASSKREIPYRTGAEDLEQTLQRLNTLGSVLMLGAHPDDEREPVIAYFSRGLHLRAAYLSATRGEGGQNLIGPEQSELLGLIRTQELLAARRIDGGEQFFTRAVDFGYSKSPEETLEKWGRERVLGDLVRVIRRFRPDVMVTRFPPWASSGHGHHTAIGQLAPEAFQAAGDPKRFPDQVAEGLEPWTAKRLYWLEFTWRNVPSPDEHVRPQIDTGAFNPVLGFSYAELGGRARSMHKSQAMGSRLPKGSMTEAFAYVAGDPTGKDLFDGVDMSWARVDGGERAGQLLARALREYRPRTPEKIVPILVQAYGELENLDGPWVEVKKHELLRAIELAAGLWIDASAERWDATPGSPVGGTLSVLNRSRVPLQWNGAKIVGALNQTVSGSAGPLPFNQTEQRRITARLPASAEYSQAEWLATEPDGAFYRVSDTARIGMPEAPPVLEAVFELESEEGVVLPFRKPVAHRWVDRVDGERTRALEIVPAVAVHFGQSNLIFPSAEAREVEVHLRSNEGKARGLVSLLAPTEWRVEPVSQPFELEAKGRERTVRFRLTPPGEPSGGEVVAEVQVGGRVIRRGMRKIEYPHIPIQMTYPEARLHVEREDVRLSSKDIGYVMGAGDRVPEALEQLGARVTLLSDEDLTALDLSRFDAIVTGVRAVNTRPALQSARERILDYVEQGGTLVVQYNTLSFRRDPDEPSTVLAPYPMQPSRDRVSVEEARVDFLMPDHPLLQQPNRIHEGDFEDWVQERGLYFMGGWDEKYDAPIASHDPGEPPRRGGLLYTRYGKGVYIFTGYSWFRQLPAGVPGAYRIFANLVSAGAVDLKR